MTLFLPLTLGELEIRNRIMMSPMSQRAAGEDARAGDWHLVHYGSRAVGGCGLVMVEDTAVAPLARTSRRALGLYEPEQARALGRIVSFCHAHGAAVGLQLAHAGRKALADSHGDSGILSASPQPFGPGWTTPVEAKPADLLAVVAAFAKATQLALDGGFDVVEVHAAHGYLLHQFLSPLTNFREDAYGGDDRARRRLLLEVVGAVRAQWPAGRPLFVRLPAGDGQAKGLGIEQMAECARACAAAGADLIDISGGTPLLGGNRAGAAAASALASELVRKDQAPPAYIRESGLPRPPAGDSPSETPRAIDRGLPVALGGGIVDGHGAEDLLRERHASLVSVGRPLLADPYWPVRAAQELGVEAPLPDAYANALQEEAGMPPRTFGRAVSSPDHSKQVDGYTTI
jgi:2,4-dienoyl-CoA reductase-like NADH-dependent reductase (Old Yellow Enzyme family)